MKTSMYIGQEFSVAGDWFYIHFTENPGMAFGWEFAGEYGKIFLTLFRIAAVFGIVYYLIKIIREMSVPEDEMKAHAKSIIDAATNTPSLISSWRRKQYM